jgi:hypothetical protein
MRSFEIMMIMMTIAATKAMMSGNPVMSIPPCVRADAPPQNETLYNIILVLFKTFGKQKYEKRAQHTVPVSDEITP